jgi:NNP family nitrate/nitrite transporter-like MFS transporter
MLYGGEDGWRYALASVGSISVIYGFFYYGCARNTPKGSTYFKPKKVVGLRSVALKISIFTC